MATPEEPPQELEELDASTATTVEQETSRALGKETRQVLFAVLLVAAFMVLAQFITPLKAWVTNVQTWKEMVRQFGWGAHAIFMAACAGSVMLGVPRLPLCAAAGLVFSVAMVIAVPGRIFWGWLGSGRVEPAMVMCWLALGMAGGTAAMALLGADWPLVLVGVVATTLSATVMSWHGVLLAEAARLAPPGQRGAATGGVLSFGQLGGLLLPLVYSAVLVATGSYGFGFTVCGLPALVVGIVLLRAPREHDAR